MSTRPLLGVLVEAAGLPLKPPKRGHRWGLKAVDRDFESSRGFVWPFPGGRATSPKRPTPGGPCPAWEGDGLCVGVTAWGLAQGGHGLTTVLIVSYTKTYGADADKVRVGWADVHHVLDVPKMIRGANLFGADLSGANLFGANLFEANLFGANLSGVILSRANLFGADLSGANLFGANLFGANLSWANLSWANLSGAYGRDDWRDLLARGAIR